MPIYAYKLTLKEAYYDEQKWTNEINNIIHAHFIRLKEDFEKGLLKHVGRTTDPTGDGFGLVIFEANTLHDAKLYMLDDPAIKAGIMTGLIFEYKWIF